MDQRIADEILRLEAESEFPVTIQNPVEIGTFVKSAVVVAEQEAVGMLILQEIEDREPVKIVAFAAVCERVVRAEQEDALADAVELEG